MEGRAKVTKEVLCEEARFILANVMAEARYGRQNRVEDIRKVCEGAVSIPFGEYVSFLQKAGYLRQDASDTLEVSAEGEQVVNGGQLTEFTERAVAHFKKLRQSRLQQSVAGVPMATQSSVISSTAMPGGRDVSGAHPVPSGRGKAARNDAAVDLLEARYEKMTSIGSGGIGTVYRARQVPLAREVAMKEVRELFGFFSEEHRGEIVRRFSEVVRAAANLSHPNILPIHDVNLEREFPYLIAELAPNGSCRRLINDAEEIPVELVLRYLLQCLHALRAAHNARVYHRSLKPEQLLIDAYGNVKISDFGMGRVVERDHAVIRQVYVGMGNVAYMAPELYNDPTAAGPQGDIYALGIIFYELLTRQLPGRRSPMPSQINPALPTGIDDIFDRMTRDARNDRYSSIDDILDDIARLDGLAHLLDQRLEIAIGEHPLSSVRFKPGADESILGLPGEDDDPDKKGSSHRPYSFQQRRAKKP